MSNYTYNPHQHVKIWLSKHRDIFLNAENQLRLVRMRETNPNDSIHLVYDSQLLSGDACTELQSFCQKHRIIPVNIQDILSNQCGLTQKEKNLLGLYQIEVNSLNQGGNLAVASDLLRWIKRIYSLGTYTDFDVEVNTQDLLPTLEVKSPLLINIGSVQSSGYDFPAINNDTLAIVDHDAAESKIQSIQQALCDGYSTDLRTTLSEAFMLQKTKMRNDLKEIYLRQWPYSAMAREHAEAISTQAVRSMVDFMMSFDPCFGGLEALSQKVHNGETPLQFRGRISRILSTNDNFIRSEFAFALPGVIWGRDRTVAGIAREWRESAKSQLTWFNWFMMPKASYELNKKMANEADDVKLLNMVRSNFMTFFTLQSVVHTSGPGQLARVFFEHALYETAAFDEALLNYGFDSNGLKNNFKSKNGIRAHATPHEMAQMQAAASEPGVVNDLSWVKSGEQAIQFKEERMNTSAAKIQRMFKVRKASLPALIQKHRLEVERHIEKIKGDLNGWFGFYRKHQREEKIRALESILTHFDEASFNATAFERNLGEYQSDDIRASLGKSQTKALVDRLTLFSRQAQKFDLDQAEPGGETEHQDRVVMFSKP